MPISIKQYGILQGIALYLQNKRYDKENPQEVSDNWIKKFKRTGYCCGFASLWLFCCKISESPSKVEGEPRDDAIWFEENAKLLNYYWECHGNINLTPDQKKNIDRFISQIEFFQNPLQYLESAEQASLDKSLEYIVTPIAPITVNSVSGNGVKNQENKTGVVVKPSETTASSQIKKEIKTAGESYYITGAFDKTNLVKLLQELCASGQYFMIGSENHETAFYKKNEGYFFYDSNEMVEGNAFLAKKFLSLDELADAIFVANEYNNPFSPSILRIKVFNFNNNNPLNLPPQEKLLRKYSASTLKRRFLINPAHFAVMAGDFKSFMYFITNRSSNPRLPWYRLGAYEYEDFSNDTNINKVSCIIQCAEHFYDALRIKNPKTNGDFEIYLANSFCMNTEFFCEMVLQAIIYKNIFNAPVNPQQISFLIKFLEEKIVRYKSLFSIILNGFNKTEEEDKVGFLQEVKSFEKTHNIDTAEGLHMALLTERSGSAIDRATLPNKSQSFLLLLAVIEYNLPKAKALIEKHADVNYKDPCGNTLLDVAISQGNEEMVRLLLEQGADINLINSNGFSPLQIAAAYAANVSTKKQRETYQKIIELILTKGGDVNYHKEGGLTALGIAARNNGALTLVLLPKTSLPNIQRLLLKFSTTDFFISTLIRCGGLFGEALTTESNPKDLHKKLFNAFNTNPNCFLELLIHALKNKNIFDMNLTDSQLTELKSFAENLLSNPKISTQQRKDYLRQIRAFETKAGVSEQDKIQAPSDVAQSLLPIIKPLPASVLAKSAVVSPQPTIITAPLQQECSREPDSNSSLSEVLIQ